MDNQTLTRQELYDLVWSNPFTTLAKKYSISDVGLRKICVKMEIPLPKSGHWEKIRFKKPVEVIKLPSNYKGTNEVTLNIREEGDSTNGSQSPLNELTKEIESALVDLIKVPDSLSHPDALVVEAKKDLTEKRGYTPRDGLVYTYRGKLNIKVSKENVSRALRFMDTFIKVWRKRGHQILIKDNATFLIINEEEIQINLREKLKRAPKETNSIWQAQDFFPTGILTFNARIHFTNVEILKDGILLPIEKLLSKLIAKLEIKGKELSEETVQRKIYWAEQEKKKLIEEEIKKRKDKELADVKQLFQNAKQWKETEILRNYLNEIEAKAIADKNLSDELKNWLLWARKKADWYDPQISAKDKLLSDADKKNITTEEKQSNNYFGYR